MVPIEKGKRYRGWHCSICGRLYRRRDTTAREVLSAWWKHVRKYHPVVYRKKKKQQVRKMLITKRKRGQIK